MWGLAGVAAWDGSALAERAEVMRCDAVLMLERNDKIGGKEGDVLVDLARFASGVPGLGLGGRRYLEGLARDDYIGGVCGAGPFLAVTVLAG